MKTSYIILLLASVLASSLAAADQPIRRTLAQGIVVPKRSALIMGLNQQFKLKSAASSTVPPITSGQNQAISSKQQNTIVANMGISSQVATNQQQVDSSTTPKAPAILLAAQGFPWLHPRGNPFSSVAKRKSQQKNPTESQSGNSNPLYLDKHQQQLLAANPNLLNPAGALLTRSDANSQFGSNQAPSRPNNLSQANVQQSQEPSGGDSGVQYRGYSLIELEVRSDADRRQIQELYANLSAALNEQAQRQNTFSLSPYVDIDFWSHKYAPNDYVDIMVSPKSKAFVLGQANRLKIRHKIKIDDIQARLDQQAAHSDTGLHSAKSPSGAELSGRSGSAAAAASGSETPNAASQTLGARQSTLQEISLLPLNESAFFENYQRLADINKYLESIVEHNGDIAQVKVIGRSSQGRYLRVLKLGYDQTDADGSTGNGFIEPENVIPESGQPQETSSNRVSGSGRQPSTNATFILDSFFRRQMAVQKVGSIWLDGGTHAREWISPATVLYIAHRLSDNHAKCRKFFDSLRLAVAQQTAADTNGERAARSSSLDVDLINGINDINTSLLGKPPVVARAQSELERTLEMLSKNPQEVADNQQCDLELDQVLRRYTFFMEPVLNPDGYEYSHTHNRLWRKTRSTSNHPIYRHFCLGADPNRNYDARHGSAGSSTHPCSQTFAGSTPFTEPETRHQSNFVYANRLGMKMYISFHSYSQMILLPFSHSKQQAPDHKDLDSVGQAAVRAIEKTHGTLYRVGPSASILYTASGTASDWAYEKAGVKYAYTIELRDTGTHGFLLPRQQIVPTGEETFNGLLAMIQQMEKNENLLTSKSILVSATGRIGSAHVGTDDMNHVPDPDKLRSYSQLNRSPLRPSLENVLDGTNTWAAPDLGPVGVRDRKQPQTADSTGDKQSQPNRLADTKEMIMPEDQANPDSGYAFEGEGDLMEPTRENIVEAAKMTANQLAGRQDYSRRIVQAAGLTSSGRSFVNSPLTSRTSTFAPRRESSDDLPESS